VQQAIEMIGQTPYLEFDEQKTAAESQPIFRQDKGSAGGSGCGQRPNQRKKLELALENPYFKATDLTGKYLQKSHGGI